MTTTNSPLGDRLTLHPAGTDQSGPRPLMLVLPGGGYAMLADHEAEPVAEWLNGLGWHAAVLRYRIAPDRYPDGLSDAAAAMTYLRSGDHGLAVDADHVGVLGFSAGGHLAASLSHATAHGFESAAVPDLAVLCYPVIALGRLGDPGCDSNLLGPDADPEALAVHQCHELVGAATPPTFLWHTADDEAVPVVHPLVYAEALARHEVPFALHVFAHGLHGLGLASDDPVVGQWTALCAAWLAEQAGVLDAR